jgi:SAM-dependent methyltransferase
MITLDLPQGTFSLEFPLDDISQQLMRIQTGNFMQPESACNTFENDFKLYWQWHWSTLNSVGTFDIPEQANILDLGCGAAIIDMVLAQVKPKAQFWLVDRDVNTHRADSIEKHGYNHPFYNSWHMVEKSIKNTGLDRTRFQTQTPEVEWPTDLDLIISSWCWCWHVPFDSYAERIFNSLVLGGRLFVDIRLDHFESITDKINSVMGSKPRTRPYRGFLNDVDVTQPIRGYRCCWTRQRL